MTKLQYKLSGAIELLLDTESKQRLNLKKIALYLERDEESDITLNVGLSGEFEPDSARKLIPYFSLIESAIKENKYIYDFSLKDVLLIKYRDGFDKIISPQELLEFKEGLCLILANYDYSALLDSL